MSAPMKSRLFFAALLFASITNFAAGAERAPIDERREAFTSGGRRIAVKTFAPRGTDRFPAVLVLHSAAGTLLGNAPLERFARTLAQRGTTVLMVRYFDRTGTIFAGEDEIHRRWPVWNETVRDAVDFAVEHPRVQPDHIGLFGYSLGAYLAVSEATQDNRIDAVVEIAGGLFRGYEKRTQRVPPLLILHGRADQRVRVENAFELARVARARGRVPALKIYEGEGHVLSRAAMEDASARALRFFDTHLQVSAAKTKRDDGAGNR